MARTEKPKNPLIGAKPTAPELPPVPEMEVLPFAPVQSPQITESVITPSGEVMQMAMQEVGNKTVYQSEVPDTGINWDNPDEYPSDVNIFPVYETIAERVRNERTGKWMNSSETKAKVNFVLLKMEKDVRGAAGSIQGKEVVECLPLPCRASSFKKLLGEKFTIKDIITALVINPGTGKDYWFAPVTPEQLKLENAAKKDRLSKMGLDHAQAMANQQRGQVVNHQIFGNGVEQVFA